MFDPFKAHDEFAAKVAALQLMRVSPRANTDELENNAAYIETLCKLVANHVEAIMADADASLSTGKIDETDASAIRASVFNCACVRLVNLASGDRSACVGHVGLNVVRHKLAQPFDIFGSGF